MTVLLITLENMNNFQEQFYQAMTRLKANSRAASTQASTQDDARVTEMINGLLVSKPVAGKKEPKVIDLQEYAKSCKTASVQGINKVKEIHHFINKGY
jgi:hypothetical protein